MERNMQAANAQDGGGGGGGTKLHSAGRISPNANNGASFGGATGGSVASAVVRRPAVGWATLSAPARGNPYEDVDVPSAMVKSFALQKTFKVHLRRDDA